MGANPIGHPKNMVRKKHKILFWLPRILSVFFALYILTFMLDIFSQKISITGVLMHLLPPLIVIVITVVAWKMAFYGGFLYILAGIFYLYLTRESLSWLVFLLVAAPAFIIGILFMISKYFKQKEKELFII